MQDPIKSKYLAFVLTSASRAALLAAFPPKHKKVIAHHVTVQFNVTEAGLKLLSGPQPEAYAVAYAVDDKVDCVLVNFDKTCKRLDGGHYHVTLSTSPTGKPVDSNRLLTARAAIDSALSWVPKQLKLEGKLELVNK
jgi:hypothetical protein